MKTVNLQLSKELKEAGYLQKDSFICWVDSTSNHGFPQLATPQIDFWEIHDVNWFAAPTADEILEQIGTGYCMGKAMTKGYYCTTSLIHEVEPNFYADSLADAAAKMWLFLKKEGLLSNQDQKEK